MSKTNVVVRHEGEHTVAFLWLCLSNAEFEALRKAMALFSDEANCKLIEKKKWEDTIEKYAYDVFSGERKTEEEVMRDDGILVKANSVLFSTYDVWNDMVDKYRTFSELFEHLSYSKITPAVARVFEQYKIYALGSREIFESIQEGFVYGLGVLGEHECAEVIRGIKIDSNSYSVPEQS